MLKLETVFNKTIIFITSGFVAVSLLFSLVYATTTGVNKENFMPVLFVAVIIALFIFFAFKLLDRLKDKSIKIITFSLFAVFLICEAFFLLFFSSFPNTDSFRCIDTALSFANGVNLDINEGEIYYGYFTDFSNNNMFIAVLCLYFKILKLLGITNYLLFAKLLNALLIFVALVLTYLSVKLMFGERNAAKVLLVFTLNPTLYLYVQWIYTLTFSLPIMMAILYLGLLIKKETSLVKRAIYSGLIAFLTALGYLIRPTSIFPLIAFAVIFVFKIKFNKAFIKKTTACLLAFLVTFTVSYFPLKSVSNKGYEEVMPYNYPVTHWIMMGLGDWGMLNSSDVYLTESFGETTAEKQAGNIKEIKKRIEEKSVKDWVKHIVKKTVITFVDGSHDFKLRYTHQESYSPSYKYIVGKQNYIFMLYCQGFRAFSFGAALIALFYLIISKKTHKKFMPFVITLLGGFAFYLIWETKQAYSLPFTPFVLVLSTYGMDKLNENINLSKKLFKKIPASVIFTLVFAVVLCVSGNGAIKHYKEYKTSLVGEKMYNYSLNTFDVKFAKSEKANELTQEFYISKDFDFLKIYVNDNQALLKAQEKDAALDIIIKNANGEIVVNKKLLFTEFIDVKKSYRVAKLEFDKVKTDSYQKYTINIKCDKNTEDIMFATSNSYVIDIYKGKLVIDGKQMEKDLSLVIGDTVYL